MKKTLLFFVLFAITIADISAQLPDLPSGGATSYGRQTLPVGSYIIAMDNLNQRTGNSGSTFNLRAYGAVVHLLNNNIKVKWVIRPGKAKDGIDFTVTNTQMTGTANVGSNDFISGAFVIFQQDTSGVVALINSFNGAASTDDVKLYKTTALPTYPDAVNGQVDVRYDYFINGVVWKPKAAILDDGGNASIHTAYMVSSGITTTNYSVETSPNFVTNCFTFASEPHNDNPVISVVQGIRTFVENGGNFLAECAAVRNYENFIQGRFQTANGFTDENGKPASPPTYSNVDLAYFQTHGLFDMSQGGSLRSWEVPTVANGANPVASFHYHTNGLDGNPSKNWTNASVSKLLPSNQLGGMVYYLGGHSYNTTSENGRNGNRMYLNAFLVPTNPQGSLLSSAVVVCASYPNPITVNCGSSAGPTNAYPLTFTLYEDLAPAGYNVGDPQLGNVVTFTAPNTAQGGISVITAPALQNSQKNYVVAIRPNSGCLQPKYLQSFCSTLPVDLISFTAKRNSAMVNLKWITASEQNNRGYYIERTLGSNPNWETIAFVPSQAQGGNSSSELTYNYTDANDFKGISQYRLKQTDLDGRFKLSDIRVVRGEDQKDQVLVFPNPSDGQVSVLFGDYSGVIRDVALYDMSGRTVKQWKGITVNNIQIENLVSGIYSLRVVIPATGEQTVTRIIVNKR
ncbi:MAG: T9SS type A sorting domain-containing protein [Sphingobacteriales bacterium]|nr:T9SS type A sorting domain-containing protein [Sphingobacteriales bacterium]